MEILCDNASSSPILSALENSWNGKIDKKHAEGDLLSSNRVSRPLVPGIASLVYIWYLGKFSRSSTKGMLIAHIVWVTFT